MRVGKILRLLKRHKTRRLGAYRGDSAIPDNPTAAWAYPGTKTSKNNVGGGLLVSWHRMPPRPRGRGVSAAVAGTGPSVPHIRTHSPSADHDRSRLARVSSFAVVGAVPPPLAPPPAAPPSSGTGVHPDATTPRACPLDTRSQRAACGRQQGAWDAPSITTHHRQPRAPTICPTTKVFCLPLRLLLVIGCAPLRPSPRPLRPPLVLDMLSFSCLRPEETASIHCSRNACICAEVSLSQSVSTHSVCSSMAGAERGRTVPSCEISLAHDRAPTSELH
jgi:hypothetical protein